MPKDEGRRRALVVPLIVFFVMMAGLSATWWAVDRQWRRNVEGQLGLASIQASHRLEDYIASRLMAIRSIGDYMADDKLGPGQEFFARSLSLQQNFGGFQALNWVAADGTIAVVVPREANADALGKNVLHHPIAAGPFAEARETQTLQMTAPLDLFQGGRGVAAYLPVVRDTVVPGYLNAVFRIQLLVEKSLGAGMLDSHNLRIVDGDSVVYESPNWALSKGRPSGGANAKILNRDWTLSAEPDDKLWAAMQAGRPTWIFALAFAFAAGACWLLRGALVRSWKDVSERSQRQQLQLDLERSAKMQALGRLAGGVAHVFNNILTAIIGNAEIIRLTVNEPEAKRSAKDIVSASQRASDLTRQLLIFSNQRHEELELIDLNLEIGKYGDCYPGC